MQTIESPYSRGARDGLMMGACMALTFFGSILSQWAPLLGWVGLAAALGVPVLMWHRMKAYGGELAGAASFSMLWMHGVVTFICGILLAGFMLTVYLTWVNPGYIASQLESVAALKGTLPGGELDEVASMASKMLEAGFIPSPISMVTELVMLATVSGSVLSIGLALALRRRPEPRQASSDGLQ